MRASRGRRYDCRSVSGTACAQAESHRSTASGRSGPRQPGRRPLVRAFPAPVDPEDGGPARGGSPQ
eukprot:9182872-Pyramimonas_sp.AAC.1